MTPYMETRHEKSLKNKRYERKFVISELDYSEIEHIIKHNPSAFSELFYERRVNNIYLDSVNLENYHDNVAGNSERIKIRIRWYGKIFGSIRKPVLEIKTKCNELGEKISFPLVTFTLDENFSLNLLKKVFLESNLPEWLIEKLKLCQPILLNSYKRKYFISADKKCRITLDKNLIFFRIGNKNNSFKEKINKDEIYVLEVKFSLKNHDDVKKIFSYLPFRLIANSKYVSGINLLNY